MNILFFLVAVAVVHCLQITDPLFFLVDVESAQTVLHGSGASDRRAFLPVLGVGMPSHPRCAACLSALCLAHTFCGLSSGDPDAKPKKGTSFALWEAFKWNRRVWLQTL